MDMGQFQDVHCNNDMLLKTVRGFSHVCDSGAIMDFFVQTLCRILQQNTRNKWPCKWKYIHKISRRGFWWLSRLAYLANNNSLLSLEFTVQTPGQLLFVYVVLLRLVKLKLSGLKSWYNTLSANTLSILELTLCATILSHLQSLNLSSMLFKMPGLCKDIPHHIISHHNLSLTKC